MPQWRKLHTKTVESLDLHDMPDDFTRLTWVMMPLVLCREGRGVYNESWLKSKIYPLRLDVTHEQIMDAINWYEEAKMIEVYYVGSRYYFQVVNWHKYQGDTNREADSPYPGPEQAESGDDSRPTQDLLKSKSSSDADADADADADKAPPKKPKRNGTGPLPDIPESLATPDFLNAWGEYRQHRKQKRSQLTEIAAKRQLNKLEKWGPDRATAAIIHTLENGWLGIFEDKAAQNGQPKPPEPPRVGGLR